MAILECKNLSKHYGKVAALEGVDLSIEPGRVVGLLGPNGSGNTTFIKLLSFILLGVCVSVAGCIGVSRLPSAMKVPFVEPRSTSSSLPFSKIMALPP